MAKLGRASKGEYENKSKVLSTRIRSDTRRSLEIAAKANGCSLSNEIERRLRHSFDSEKIVSEVFGDRRNYAVMKLLYSSIERMFNFENGTVSWLDDRYLFDQARDAIGMVLKAIEPTGETRVPPGNLVAFQAAIQTASLLETIQGATLGDELATDPKVRKLARMKSDLGEIGSRRARVPLHAQADPAEPIAHFGRTKRGRDTK